MRKKLILLLAVIFALSGLCTGYASENVSESTTEDIGENVITLEQAKELAGNKCRDLTRYEISTEIAKYQLYRADDQYDDASHEMDNSMYRLNNLNEQYSDLQEQLNKPDADAEDIKAVMESIQNQIETIWEQLDQESDSVESLLDRKRDAETQHNQAVIDEENYQKRLDYLVDDLYATILNQEQSLNIYTKERELKQYSLSLERVRVGLGRSNQLQIDQLSTDLAGMNQKVDVLNSSIKASKGNLNDMMWRDYDDPLTLTPFEVSATADIPEYDILLIRATDAYDTIDEIKRDIEERKDDLDYVDDDNYQEELLELEIDQKQLQLKDEKTQLVETIINLMSNVTSKQESYQISLTNYEKAKKDYERNEKKFEMGRISKLDLMQSELDYLNSENEKISASYDFHLAQRALELAEEGVLI